MKIKKKDRADRGLIKLVIISFAILYALCCFAIYPASVTIADDVAFEDTVVPELVEYLGSLTEIVAIAVAYAVIVYAIYSGKKKNVNCTVLIFAISTLLKYLATMAMYWAIYGSIPLEWGWDLANAVYYTALELLQLLIVIGVASNILNSSKRARPLNNGAEYRIKGLYDRKNPLMRAALWCAVISAAAKILGILIDDVFTMIISGLPQNAETVPLMLLNYVSNVIFGAVCYFVMLIVLVKLAEKREHANA